MSDNKLRKLATNNITCISEALQILRFPGKVLTDSMSAAAVKVGTGNILKIHVSADTYVAFSDSSTMPGVTVTTSPAVLLPAGMHYVVSGGDFVRMSANPSRVELLEV